MSKLGTGLIMEFEKQRALLRKVRPQHETSVTLTVQDLENLTYALAEHISGLEQLGKEVDAAIVSARSILGALQALKETA